MEMLLELNVIFFRDFEFWFSILKKLLDGDVLSSRQLLTYRRSQILFIYINKWNIIYLLIDVDADLI